MPKVCWSLVQRMINLQHACVRVLSSCGVLLVQHQVVELKLLAPAGMVCLAACLSQSVLAGTCINDDFQ